MANGAFQINDIELDIPPEQIIVKRRSVNNVWNTLRTRSSIKTKSGYSQLDIMCHVKFVEKPSEGINGLEKLRDLVSQLRVTPFCWVENEFLRDSILGGLTGQSMVLALRHMEIRKATSVSPDVIEVDLYFAWFNFHPYLKDFTFREDIFLPKPVKNPKYSKAWKLLYKAEQARGGYPDPAPTRLGKQNTVLKTWQFALVPKKKYFKLKKDLNLLRDLQKRLVGDDIQRLETSEHPGYVDRVVDRLKDRMSKEEYQEFTSSVFGRTTSMGSISVHEMLALVKGAIASREETFKEYKNAFEVGSGWKEVKLKDGEGYSLQEYESELGNKLDEATNSDNRKKDSSILMRREQVLDMRQVETIPTGISISFENVLATMPLIGQPYPTYQHIGSIDATVTLTMLATDNSGVRAMTNFYTIVEDQARKYRAVPSGHRNVRVTNDLINLCGLNEFIVESFDTTTIPGQPGTTQMILTMMDNPISASTREALQPAQAFVSNQELRLMVLKVLNDNVRFNAGLINTKNGKLEFTVQIGGFFSSFGADVSDILYKYKGSETNDRESMFRNLTKEYAANLGEAMQNVIRSLSGKSKDRAYTVFKSLFILTDDELPGISRIQKDLHTPLTKADKFDILFGDKPIEPEVEETMGYRPGKPGGQATYGPVTKSEFSIQTAQYGRDAVQIWQEQQALGNPDDEQLRKAALARSKLREETISGDTFSTTNDEIIRSWINSTISEYRDFIIPFLDKVLRSNVISLPQFKKVKEALQKVHMQSSGTAYPDFPIDQVVDRLRKNKDLYGKVTRRLDEAGFLADLGLKGLGVSSLINPDFYLYRGSVEAAGELIGQDTLNVAREAIQKGQYGSGDTSMAEVEKDWITGAYKSNVIGEKRYDRIEEASKHGPEQLKEKLEKRREALEKELEKKPEDDSEENQAQKDVRQKERKKALVALDNLRKQQTLTHWQPLDLDGGLLGPSIHEISQETDGKNTIETTLLDNTNKESDPLITSINYRAEEDRTLRANLHHQSVKHNFKGDGSVLDFTTETDYRPFKADPKKVPQFYWPVWPQANTKISSTYGERTVAGHENFHNGIDIVSSRGRAFTDALQVVAAADGKIVAIKKGARFKSGKTWGEVHPDRVPKDPTESQQKFWDKEAGTATSIKVQHDGGYETVYTHMDWDNQLKELYGILYDEIPVDEATKQAALRVYGGRSSLGSVGDTGYSTGPHLHFEIRKKGLPKPVDPEPILKGASYRSQGPLSWINPNSESLFTKSVEQLEKDLTGPQGHSLMRAYPTFRLYFIESDLKERKRFGFDDFFSFSSIQEIQVIKSRKIAADLCVIRLTNVSGVLSNRKFQGNQDETKARGPDGRIVKEDPKKPSATNTMRENPISSLMLQPGIQIQLRLGYDNNPDELEKTFNGVITDVQFSGTDDIVEITCQSYGIEMVQNIYGEAKTYGGIISDAGKTSTLLEQLMGAPEMVHFGRWQHGDKATNTSYSLLTARWKAQPQPQDDNIFAPTGAGSFGIFDDAPEYTMYRTTIWDVFQEMTLRHPGYIASSVPYDDYWGPRMTMFFGVPDQLYFARDPTDKENENKENLKRFLSQAGDDFKNVASDIEQLTDPYKASKDVSRGAKKSLSGGAGDTDSEIQDIMVRRQLIRYAKDRGFVKPFRSYHLLTSTNHILHNNITSSSWRAFNVVTLQYEDDTPDVNEETGVLTFDDAETFTMACEAGIPDEEKREMFAQYHNCLGYEMAKRYCLALLSNSLKEGYRGSIVTIGNEKIKPHDICYLVDEYTDMYGPVEVEQVVHRFSQQNGFVTEIVPDMCVHVNQMSTLTTGDAMGLVAEWGLRKVGFQSLASIVGGFTDKGPKQEIARRFKSQGLGEAFLSNGVAVGARAMALGGIAASLFFPAAVLGVAAGVGVGFVGSFILRKYVTRSQLAHPFRYSPLTLHGKPMTGGLPIRHVNSTFTQKVDKWFKDTGEAMPLYIDHLSDKLAPNNWINPVGDF